MIYLDATADTHYVICIGPVILKLLIVAMFVIAGSNIYNSL